MEITLQDMAKLIGAILIVSGFVAAIVRAYDNSKNNSHKIDMLERDHRSFKERMYKLENKVDYVDDLVETLQGLKKAINLLCRAESAVMEHIITGQAVDKVKKIKDEIDSVKEIV